MNELNAIIVACVNNVRNSQRMLYEHYYGYALKIVFRYIYRYDKAVDVVNDGFVKIFKNLEKFKPGDGLYTEKIFLGWLKKIMVNTAIDELRKNQLIPQIGELTEHILEPAHHIASADEVIIYKNLIEQVRKLPPSYRAVFNMYVIDGFSHQEISEALGISVGACKSNLFKAKANLRKILNKDEREADVCNL